MMRLQRYSFSATSFSSCVILSRSSARLSRVTSLNSRSLIREIMALLAPSNCSCAARSTCSDRSWNAWCSSVYFRCSASLSSTIRSSSACICLRNSTLSRSTLWAMETASWRRCSDSCSFTRSCDSTDDTFLRSSSTLRSASSLACRSASSRSFCHWFFESSVARLCSSTSSRKSSWRRCSASCSFLLRSVSYFWISALFSSFCSASYVSASCLCRSTRLASCCSASCFWRSNSPLSLNSSLACLSSSLAFSSSCEASRSARRFWRTLAWCSSSRACSSDP
mmetsp:Transcript_51348/g.122211  ORF Transcript_51348/g.122211 Transcript_51348/m.122211 type:complete len:281 (-) Transcript_51348:1316-2158(-)